MSARLAVEVPPYVVIVVSVVRTVPHLHPQGIADARAGPARTSASEFRQRPHPRHATLAV
ncbi:hypothetical protein [Streptomyces sp. NPDC001930]|uniref:hypothetical protein n=1 Tax=Streptomyces sp. NPDC001930 TaxID=3364625 RepID=UPI00368BEEB2